MDYLIVDEEGNEQEIVSAKNSKDACLKALNVLGYSILKLPKE